MQKNYANRISELEAPCKWTGNSFKHRRHFYVQRKIQSLIMFTVMVAATSLVTSTTHSQLVQTALAADTITKQSLLTYQNSTYGVSIKYPSTWGVQTGANSPSDTIIDGADVSPPIALDPNAVANFRIAAENLEPSDSRNLDLYLRNAINGYRFNATDFHIDFANTNAHLAGKPAYALVFLDTFNGFPMKTMVMGTFSDKHGNDNNGRFYYVQYTAEASRYDQLLPAVHQMINSFELAVQT